MPRKTIVRLGVRVASDTEDTYQELPLVPGSASIQISSKKEAAGTLWTTKITARLIHDVILLHEPCIFRVRTTDGFYFIGTADLPVNPSIKEEHLVAVTIEYKSKIKPQEHPKVLYIAPDCE